MSRNSVWNRNPLACTCFVSLIITLCVLVTKRGQTPTEPGRNISGNGWSSNHDGKSAQHVMTPGQGAGTPREKPNTHGHLVVSSNYTGVHPIKKLIKEAEEKAKAIEKKNKSIKYLRDAVADYETAFGVRPPRGFDEWYHFARDHRSYVAPSLLPSAVKSVLPYLAYPASLLRERVGEAEMHGSSFSFEFVPAADEEGTGTLQRGGANPDFYRSDDNELLLKPLLPYIPKPLSGQPNLRLVFSGDDGPTGQAHHEVVAKSTTLGRSGRTWSSSELSKKEAAMRHTFGWAYTCPPGSPLRKGRLDIVLNDAEKPTSSWNGNKSFISNIMHSYDYCHNPNLWDIHGTLIEDKSRGSHEMVPRIATCKLLHNTDVLGVPLDAVNQTIKKTDWEAKTIPKAFWRGSLTGAFHNDRTNWRKSQRERMCYKVKETGTQKTVLVDLGNGTTRAIPYDVETLNAHYLDVAPVGGAVQCDPGECEIVEKEFEYGRRVQPEDTLKYKYNLDLDGNGWSSRFTRLLKGNSVILKSTAFPEWFTEILVPWYHYVPVQVDYSDLYDIMAYFVGTPDGTGVGHDDEAKAIAANAYQFTQKRMRWVDMQSYTLLMALEWNRMMSSDRQAAAYVKAEV